MVSNWRQIEKNDASSSSLAEEAAQHLPGWRRKGNKGQIWLKKKIQSEKQLLQSMKNQRQFQKIENKALFDWVS